MMKIAKILCLLVILGSVCAVLVAPQQGFAAASPATPGVSKGNGEPVTAGSNSGGTSKDNGEINLARPSSSTNYCGGPDSRVQTSFNIGCAGKGNAMVDMLFAIIRFLSNGVGLVVIGSIVVGGIQYTMSRGDPQATANAINRIRNSLFALLIFIFAYAILNYLLPKGFLQ